MYVDWEYYKIFYYVAKYQNFTRAARVLGNNQPNITHAMNRLESQLNCVLFIRSNRGVTLTPEGELLYSRIASAAVQIQDAEEELSATATLEHGAISISTTETALNIYLSEKLRAFHTEYPGIRLRISNHSTPQAVQAVRNGEVDFAIVTTPAEVENGLKMVELMSFYEVLVGGRTFTALASQTLNLKELAGYPLICLNEESMTRSFYRQLPGPRRRAQARHRGRHHRPDAHAGKKRAGPCLCAGTHGPGAAAARRAGAAALAGDHPLPLHLPCLRPSPAAEHRRPQVPAAADQSRGSEHGTQIKPPLRVLLHSCKLNRFR